MNIAILMSVWAQNLGDELILKNEIKLLEEKYSPLKCNFKVFTYDLEDKFVVTSNIEYLEYFPIWIKKAKNIFRNIKNFINFSKTLKWADKVVIGWGWIFYENETQSVWNPLAQWLFRVKMADYYKKDIIFYGVSIEIKNDSPSLKIIQEIFKSAKEIYVRNKNSSDLLIYLWIESEIIDDPVFYDKILDENIRWNDGFLVSPNHKSPIQKIEVSDFSLDYFNNLDFSGKKIWLAFRSGKMNDEINQINSLIDLIISRGWEIILLPHSFHQTDILANDYEFLKQFVREKVSITNSMQETYDIYKKNLIDICISMRLHSMILCQVYDIDYIVISYSKKTSEF